MLVREQPQRCRAAALLLCCLGGGLATSCPEQTRPTIYGAVTLVCSGRGECVDGKCVCQDGAEGAAARRAGWRDLWWQVEPANIVKKGGADCGGTIRTKAPPELLTRHYALLIATYGALFVGCGWLFGPAPPPPLPQRRPPRYPNAT